MYYTTIFSLKYLFTSFDIVIEQQYLCYFINLKFYQLQKVIYLLGDFVPVVPALFSKLSFTEYETLIIKIIKNHVDKNLHKVVCVTKE